jgi:hopene-associated glycosyltransferase HpnB
MEILIVVASLLWLGLLLAPWRPWSTKEQLEAFDAREDLSDVTVLIPARNEAATISRTLSALTKQGLGLRVILVDDQSTDGTADAARSAFTELLTIISGQTMPEGWSGKLWALEQGRVHAHTGLTLLLDADIELAPGMVATLVQKLVAEKLDLVSIMAELRMVSLAEKMLVPAFVYFFKLIYPFALGNKTGSRVGVAAGGCILIKSAHLEKIGGFAALKGALIDDCTLARKIKEAGGRNWIGLSHSVRSHRPYPKVRDFWEMVARTAYTQLGYSVAMLALTTLLMLLAFWIPVLGLFWDSYLIRFTASIGLGLMAVCYIPTLTYYRRSVAWVFVLPLIGLLYLSMTWSSALRYWQGKRSQWKGRVYSTRSQEPGARS